MAGSVNKAIILVGSGARPRGPATCRIGGKVVSFCHRHQRKLERPRLRRAGRNAPSGTAIAIFNQKLGEIAEKYLKKGSKVYIEGADRNPEMAPTRTAIERETTEIVLGKFRGELTLLDGRGGGGEAGEGGGYGGGGRSGPPMPPRNGRVATAPSGRGGGGGGGGWDKPKGGGDLDDDIPF